ncbi:MAG: hypothetical protein HXX81_05620 [Campylobacterales bacterium]|nr:hypothetical protein [Campylobacterales bacterium]
MLNIDNMVNNSANVFALKKAINTQEDLAMQLIDGMGEGGSIMQSPSQVDNNSVKNMVAEVSQKGINIDMYA